MKHKIAILGAGRMGRSIAEILFATGRFDVILADRFQAALDELPETLKSGSKVVDVMDASALGAFLEGRESVVSACSFTENPSIAKVALQKGLSYFDLTEDVACTAAIEALAKDAKEGQVFVPQCGLAPGFIGILGYDLFSRLETVHRLKMRVGALPIHPTNSLQYNLTWSTKGLINEYCHPCLALRGSVPTEIQPLQDLENLAVNGVQYEAFNTSGGLGSLCQTLEGKVTTMDYQSIRYPGHCEKMRFLLNDLRFGETPERQQALMDLFDDAVPRTEQDKVLIYATAVGENKGRRCEVSEVFEVPAAIEGGRHWTAIQRTTASGICVAVDLHVQKKLLSRGFVRQEDISLTAFLESPMAKCYSSHRYTVPQA